jgi:hypothetical protein
MRRLVILLCLVLAAPALAWEAVPEPAAGFAFPESLGEFRLGDRQTYGDPRLGAGWDYWGADRTLITVIVYDLGRRDIGDGPDDPQVREQFAQAQRDLRRAVAQGAYRSASRLEAATTLSGQFLQASFDLVRSDGARRRSHILLRGHRGHFVKIRATGPPTRQSDSRIAAFLQALGPILGIPD